METKPKSTGQKAQYMPVPSITRRNLLKWGSIAGSAMILPGCAKERVLKPAEELPPPRGEESFVESICGMCPAGCGLRVRIIDSRAVGLSGTADHPINLGTLCPQGMASLQDVYHPDRVRTPLARVGHRGSGKWKEISWSDAIRQISNEISQARRNSRPFVALSRPMRDVHQEILKDLAERHGGRLVEVGYSSSDVPRDAYRALQGGSDVFWNSSGLKLLVSFGQDWLQTHPSPVETQRRFAQMRRSPGSPRTRMIQVESRFSVTGAKADEWIPIRPGTEGIFALAVLRQLISDGGQDEAFLRNHANGFDRLRLALDRFTLDYVSMVTGTPEKNIRSLASQFASTRPAVAITYRGSDLTQFAVHAINAVTGNIGPGKAFSVGGTASDLPGRVQSGDAAPGVLLVDRVNPVFTAPDLWKPVFQRAEFVVAIHSHLTESAEAADLVLPCHSPLEGSRFSFHDNFEGERILDAAPSCIKPLYDTKEPGEIFSELASALGGNSVPKFDAYLKKRLAETGSASIFDEKSEKRWLKLAGNSKGGFPFHSPSGKFEFQPLTDALAKLQLPPIEDSEFPLYLQGFTPLAFFGGEGAHLPYLQSLAGVQSQAMWETWSEIHPETAAKYRIADGDTVWIASRRGKIPAKARVVSWASPEVVSVPLGLGHTAYGRWAKGAGSNPMSIAEGETTRVSLTKA